MLRAPLFILMIGWHTAPFVFFLHLFSTRVPRTCGSIVHQSFSRTRAKPRGCGRQRGVSVQSKTTRPLISMICSTLNQREEANQRIQVVNESVGTENIVASLPSSTRKRCDSRAARREVSALHKARRVICPRRFPERTGAYCHPEKKRGNVLQRWCQRWQLLSGLVTLEKLTCSENTRCFVSSLCGLWRHWNDHHTPNPPHDCLNKSAGPCLIYCRCIAVVIIKLFLICRWKQHFRFYQYTNHTSEKKGSLQSDDGGNIESESWIQDMPQHTLSSAALSLSKVSQHAVCLSALTLNTPESVWCHDTKESDRADVTFCGVNRWSLKV